MSKLARILDTPDLARIVPQLPAELLHRVIEHCGLDDCGPLVALATPGQLERIFDLDLWRAARPGVEEQFDADRFGQWLEVLAESGADVAAQKLSEMDVKLVIAGLAQHVRVFDDAAVAPYMTTDGELIEASVTTGEEAACEIGGYRIEARHTSAWDAIVEVLTSFDMEHPDGFDRVMRGCVDLSNSGHEIDGLDDLLGDGEQAMFDVAFDRERRRGAGGFVAPAEARAFLQMSRQLRPGVEDVPAGNPIARAYFRAAEETQETPPTGAPPVLEDSGGNSAREVATVIEALRDAGILDAPPRALLTGSRDAATPVAGLHAHMQFVFDRHAVAYAARTAELVYLANVLVAGCAIQARPFTIQEASDAAAAICNLGLENWPRYRLAASPLADDFLVHRDLVSVFQIGWTVLHDEVVMHAAVRVIDALNVLQCHDRGIQAGLDALRVKLTAGCRAGTPWQARGAMEVLASLDMPAWAALLGVIDECPVLHAAIRASQARGTRAIGAGDFEFITGNGQISAIHRFMDALAETLSS